MKRKILGISAFYHDAAAAVLQDDEIMAAAPEERFSREKHDASFPEQAVEYCLEESGSTLGDLDAVVFYEKPLRKFERLLETYYAFAPRGLRSFLSAIPVWIKEKLFQKNVLRNHLRSIGDFDESDLNLLFTEHHQSHAASAFYPSPFRDAAILTLDGVGEWATTTFSRGSGRSVEILDELHFPHSLGLLYSAFTYYLGFRVNSGEYKLMGLAPYGNEGSSRVQKFEEIILDKLVDLKSDGSFLLDQRYFTYATGLRMVDDSTWENLFGIERRAQESEFKQDHCDLARALQNVTEMIILRMARTLRQRTGEKNLCLAGGVALNCVANGKLLREDIFDNIWIQPAAGDAGGALGAAYAVYHEYFDEPRDDIAPSPGSQGGDHQTADDSQSSPAASVPVDKMKGSLLGPEYTGKDIERMARRHDAPYRRVDDPDDLCDVTAKKLENGTIVGWFQGRMEWGPRALGHRSILADPRKTEMQKRINREIKYREDFRPFAPSVRAEDVSEYFETGHPSPYMLIIGFVREERRTPRPENYRELTPKERAGLKLSDVPAVTHLDYSARYQTVHRETNPRYHQLLSAFRERTGYGILLNTSLNLRGEPIVRSPGEAYQCFMRSEMDCLVIDDYVFERPEQPEWTGSVHSDGSAGAPN